MISRKHFCTPVRNKMMIVLSLFIPVMITIFSCSGSRKLVSATTVAASSGKNYSKAQEVDIIAEDKIPTGVFESVEVMPKFPGGRKALKEFIDSNIQYPRLSKEKNIEGKVFLKFCIMYDGRVSMIKILRSISPELDQEAIRVIKMLPRWQPGRQGGKPVNVWQIVPVAFAIEDTIEY